MGERLMLPVAAGAECRTTHWACACVLKHQFNLTTSLNNARGLLEEWANMMHERSLDEITREDRDFYVRVMQFLEKGGVTC